MVKVFQWLAVITAVLAVIAGIVAGILLGDEPQYSFEDKEFAWASAIAWWISGAITGIFIFGFARVLECLESMTYSLGKIEAAVSAQNPEIQKPSLGNSRANLSKLSGYKFSANDAE